jgi:two-component system, NarL family, sensor histidine kinase UhpB
MAPPAPPPLETGDQLFRAVANDAPVMLWMTDVEGRAVFVNRAWLAFTGRTFEQELGFGWLEGLHPDDRPGFEERAGRSFRVGKPFTEEYRLRRADGQHRWMLAHGSPRIGADGEPLGYFGSCADITERKEHQVAASEAEARLRRLVENARDLVYRMRLYPTRAVEYVGGAVEAITGHTPEEFYANPDLVRQSVHPDDARLIIDTVNHAERLQTAVTLRWVHPDGSIVWAEHQRAPVYDATGRFVAVEGIARDVTHRVEAERRLKESEKQMRELAGRLQAAREEERTALARELHDELGQTLTAIKLELGRAATVIKQGRPQNLADRLQSLIGLVEIGIETVRRLATNLRPPMLDHLGLGAAIRWEASAFRARSGLRCHVQTTSEGTSLELNQQTALFRIFQESLTNVVRHAQASAVRVTLIEDERAVELRIEDNGRGISAAQAADPRAIGLLGMRERAALIGGSFDIAGEAGKGTAITVRVAPRRSADPPETSSAPAGGGGDQP